jgi:hypothetical protein
MYILVIVLTAGTIYTIPGYKDSTACQFAAKQMDLALVGTQMKTNCIPGPECLPERPLKECLQTK